MAQKDLEIQYARVEVSSDLAATLTCPNCGLTRQKDVSGFFHPGKSMRIRCRCTCRHGFGVLLGRWQERPSRQVRWVVKKHRNTHRKDAVLLLCLFFIVLMSVFYLFFDTPSDASLKMNVFTGAKKGDIIRSVYDSGD